MQRREPSCIRVNLCTGALHINLRQVGWFKSLVELGLLDDHGC